jgi:hypothetical protein
VDVGYGQAVAHHGRGFRLSVGPAGRLRALQPAGVDGHGDAAEVLRAREGPGLGGFPC